MKRIGTAAIILCASLTARAAHDKTRANSYDDGWESNWVDHCTTVYEGGSGKTDGFVLQVGDSITHANPYCQFARNGTGATAEDNTVRTWIGAANWGSGNFDTTSKNGFYLAVADTVSPPDGLRGMTASSGIDTAQFLLGSGNGGPAMPQETASQSTAQSIVANPTYTLNIHIDTLITAFQDARFAVLMLGTNDVTAGRSTNDFITGLTSIIDKLEAANIVVVLSTVPPYVGKLTEVQSHNAGIRSLAQSRQIPLIDLYAEILARQPSNWSTTLIHTDGIHLSGTGSSSDPYTPGGVPATHTTGDNCLVGGYLLRSWLTVQKLKEVKAAVVDNAFIASISTTPSPPEGTPPLDVGFSGSATGGTGTYTEYAWDWDNDTVFDETGQYPNHQFATEGTYPVTLKVTDSASDTAQAIVTVVVSTGGGPSGTVTLQEGVGGYNGCIDAHILEDTPGGQYGNVNDLQTYGPGCSTHRRVVIKFDLGSYIPAESTVTLATLELYDWNAYKAGDVAAHRLTADWIESQVSWDNSGVAAWSGGSYAATATDTVSIGGGDLGWKSWDITDLVSAWHEGTYGNYGVAVLASGDIEHRFRSSEWTDDISLRPKLTIDYGSTGPSTPSVTASADKTTILQWGTVNFSASASGGTPGYTYSWDWDVSDGIQQDATGQNPSHQFIAAGTYTVTVTVTDDTPLTNTDTIQIVVLADSDKDGIYDQWEIDNFTGGIVECLPGGDPDGDNFTNLQEYLAGSDPNDADTDRDGIPDGQDSNPTKAALPLSGCGAPCALALLVFLVVRRKKG